MGMRYLPNKYSLFMPFLSSANIFVVCTCYDIIFQSTLERPDNINAM